MRWSGENVFVAHALKGETVGLEQVGDRHWQVWFNFYEIGVLDCETMAVRRPRPKEPKEAQGGEQGRR